MDDSGNICVIDSGVPGPSVLITAGVHGDEYEPVLAAMETERMARGSLLLGKLTIVRVANISAYNIGSRYGEDGLDLARICPGKEGGSASEKYAFAVSQMIAESDYYVDLHTGGLAFDIYPLAGYLIHGSQTILEIQRQMAMIFNLPVIWGTDKNVEGRTLSVARDHNVPAIYLEYGGGSGLRQGVITKYRDGCINLLSALNMISREYGKLDESTRYWVEDARSGSGFLQGKMPAPTEGIFSAFVKPGDVVKKGQVFGDITDPVTNEVFTVVADMDGLVFMVRTQVKVRKDDALGGILPVSKPGKIIIE